MKKTLIHSALIGALVAMIGSAAFAQASAISGSSATSYVGTGGGSSLSVGVNRQTATLNPGVTYGGAATVLNQSVGAAGTSGSVATSTFSAAANLSTGNGTGAAGAGGNSTATLATTANYSTANTVKGSVMGDAAGRSGSDAASARNGASLIAGNVGAGYLATADSSRTGLFSTNRTANSFAVTSVVGSPTTQHNWGTGTSSIDNQGAANAGGQSQSGTVVSP